MGWRAGARASASGEGGESGAPRVDPARRPPAHAGGWVGVGGCTGAGARVGRPKLRLAVWTGWVGARGGGAARARARVRAGAGAADRGDDEARLRGEGGEARGQGAQGETRRGRGRAAHAAAAAAPPSPAAATAATRSAAVGRDAGSSAQQAAASDAAQRGARGLHASRVPRTDTAATTCACVMDAHARQPWAASQRSTPYAQTSPAGVGPRAPAPPPASASGGMCVTVPYGGADAGAGPATGAARP